MKINKKSSNKKKIFFIATAVSLVICVCLILYMQAKNSNTNNSTPSDLSVDKTNRTKDSGADSSNAKDSTASTSASKEDPTPNNPPKTQVQNPNYVEAPLLNPPTVSDPYPIENERYRISKVDEKTFNATLYPIANNPEYSDYNAQLKAYKEEVLTYLKKRYGSTSNLTINWSPSNAANL